MTGSDDDRNVQEGHEAMGLDETTLDCDWCAMDPSDPGQPASWGVTVRDCCADVAVDYLLCDRHWTLLRDQQLPGMCPRCGATADSLDMIVTHVIPIGDYDAVSLCPSGDPVDTTRLSELQVLPPAIRRPICAPTPVAPESTIGASPQEADATAVPDGESDNLAVTIVDDCDYEDMAEREWRRRREEAIAADDVRNYCRPMQQLSEQLDATTDPTSIHQIATQIHVLDHNRNTAAYQAREALKHDQHAYALWRQTGDGQYFIEWMQRAFTVATWILDREDEWVGIWQSMLDSIPAPEVQAHATGNWIARPLRYRAARYVLAGGLATCLTGAIAGLFVPLMFIVAAVGGAAAGCALIMMREDGWTAENEAVAERARRRRIGRFGFDPLDEPDRAAPSWTTHPNARHYASELQAWALVGFEDHPRPEDLPEPHYLPLANPNSVPLEMRHVLTR